MYYLQNKPSTSLLCLVEPELWSLKDGVRAQKTCFFSNFLMVISQILHDLKKKKIIEGFFPCSTTVPNFKTIRGGPWKNIQKFVELTWNDPIVIAIIKNTWRIYPMMGVADIR